MKEMRRQDRAISKEEAFEILTKGEYGVLSTFGLAGYPYGVPVNYAVVEDKIYFHCAVSTGEKVENIRANPKVCFTVVGDTMVLSNQFSTKYESVIVFGEAKEIQGTEKKEGLIAITEKYAKEYMEKGLTYIDKAIEKVGIYTISIDHITGKANR